MKTSTTVWTNHGEPKEIDGKYSAEHDCSKCGEHFSTCICEDSDVALQAEVETDTTRQALPFGAYDAEGKLRATFDSEPEAYFYVRNRGHMHGGTHKPIANASK